MAAAVLNADQILLCSSEPGTWSPADVDAVQTALTSKFADEPNTPTIRVITGLGTAM